MRRDAINDLQPELGLPPMVVERPRETERTIYHVGVSGGKDSAAALLWMVHESGIPREKIDATFCDTGNEHEWTYEHIRLLSERVHPITTLRPVFTFFDLALSKKRFPSPGARYCTESLKIVPAQEHITNLMVRGHYPIAVSGVRADESTDRANLPEWDYSGTLLCVQWRPLIRWQFADVVAIHERHGIPLNPLYAVGAQRVGCWPCIMSRKDEIRNIALKFPHRIEQIRAAELAFEKAGGRFSSFFGPDKCPPPVSLPHRPQQKRRGSFLRHHRRRCPLVADRQERRRIVGRRAGERKRVPIGVLRMRATK